jgi:hypothetical protein
MATGLYPGIGTPLYGANASYPREPVWTGMREADPVIPNASSSVGKALNAGLTTAINVQFAAAPAGTAFSIMYDVDDDVANEYALDTVAAVALQKVYTWSTDGLIQLDGFIRITNSGGQNINEAYLQQRATMEG